MQTSTAAANGSLSAKDKADVLMRKYAILRDETIFSLVHAKNHIRYLQFILAIIIAVVGLSVQGEGALLHNRLFLVVIMYALTTVVGFVVMAVLDSYHQMIVVGARLSTIESRVNELAGETLLLWETTLSGAYHGSGIRPVPGVLHPGICLNVFLFPLVVVGIFFIPVYAAYLFWDEPIEGRTTFRIFVVVGLVYSIFSAVLMFMAWFGVIFRSREGAKLVAVRELARQKGHEVGR